MNKIKLLKITIISTTKLSEKKNLYIYIYIYIYVCIYIYIITKLLSKLTHLDHN